MRLKRRKTKLQKAKIARYYREYRKKRRTDEDYSKAILRSAGSQVEVAKVLGLSRQAVSQRLKHSLKLEKEFKRNKEHFIKVAVGHLVLGVIRGEPWAVRYMLDRRGGSEWQIRGKLDLEGTFAGGVLMVPQPFESTPGGRRAWERQARREQKLLAEDTTNEEKYDRKFRKHGTNKRLLFGEGSEDFETFGQGTQESFKEDFEDGESDTTRI